MCPGSLGGFGALDSPVSPEASASVTKVASPVSPCPCRLGSACLRAECLRHGRRVLPRLRLAPKKLHSFISLSKVIFLFKLFCLETPALDERAIRTLLC